MLRGLFEGTSTSMYRIPLATRWGSQSSAKTAETRHSRGHEVHFWCRWEKVLGFRLRAMKAIEALEIETGWVERTHDRLMSDWVDGRSTLTFSCLRNPLRKSLVFSRDDQHQPKAF